jgi:hypothetical protein
MMMTATSIIAMVPRINAVCSNIESNRIGLYAEHLYPVGRLLRNVTVEPHDNNGHYHDDDDDDDDDDDEAVLKAEEKSSSEPWGLRFLRQSVDHEHEKWTRLL